MKENGKSLGVGMKFPPQINPVTGKVETSSGLENIKESVYLILMTQKRERFIHPEFGSEILKFAFMEYNESMFHLMASNLEKDILREELRVDEVKVSITPEQQEGYLLISVDYTVKNTGQTEQMSIPVYYRD